VAEVVWSIMDSSDRSMNVSASTERSGLTCSLQLGWQIAYLYALVDDDLEPPQMDTLLPLNQSLQPADQVEVQLRTAAGDARRAGLSQSAAALDALVPQARAAAQSKDCADFRAALSDRHVEIDKELWASCEGNAKAYELGNGLSDTYNRICRATRGTAKDARKEWRDVFDKERIQRLKDRLHDLQSRLDPRAVTVVSDHLDAWEARVLERGNCKPPPLRAVRLHLRRQTVIWRQLLSGDKEPEAFLGRNDRVTLRGEMAKLVWKRYLPWLPVLILVVGALVMALTNKSTASTLEKLLASAAGVLGITVASVALTIRTRMSEWTELLWNRAVALRITAVTLTVDDLLPPPAHDGVVEATRRATRRTVLRTRQAPARVRGESHRAGWGSANAVRQ
jgi:hypothetical protein